MANQNAVLNLTGIRIIPAFFMALLMLFSGAHAADVVFYSLPEKSVNASLKERLQREFPGRKWILLNGTWDLKNPKTGAFIGNARIPCTFDGAEQVLFEKRLVIKPQTGKSYVLHLGETVGDVTVRLNDSLLYVGSRNYYPLPLSLPDDLIRDGENVFQIEVRCQHRRRADLPGFMPVDLPRVDAGILNAVYLEIRPNIFIESLIAGTVAKDSTALFTGTATLNRTLPDSLNYNITVQYLSAEKTLFQKKTRLQMQGKQTLALPEFSEKNFVPWSPETPRRYWVEVRIDSAGKIIDSIRRPVAARVASTNSDHFLLNDQPLYLEGVNYVYQNMAGSTLLDPALIRRDLQDIKARGFNAIRVVMHPMPEWFYQICDETGLLCFQDLPFVYWLPAGARQLHFEHWQAIAQHLAKLSRRYSCIAGIGAAFYLDGANPTHQKRLSVMVEDLRQHTAVPLYASTFIPDAKIAEKVDFQLVDILGRRRVEKNLERVRKPLQNHLFFPSAFSKAMTFRVDSTLIAGDLLLVRDFYQKLKDGQLPGNIQGQFIQTYSDFYLDLPSIQNGLETNFFLNRVGLVDLKRQPRDLQKLQRQQAFSPTAPVGMIREDRSTHSFLYILIGFLNVFVFLITYRRYRVFRQSLIYSISKPHGFFVNLQERISIPYKQSFFVLLVIGLNGAVIYSSAFYYYRNHLLADYLLSLLFYTPWLKLQISKIVWDQAMFIIVGTAAIVLFFYGLAVLIKIYSLFGRSRVLFNQALAVSIWSAAPFVILLPLGIVMYSLLLMMKNHWILLGVLLYFHVWAYLRWVNGARVLTDRLYSRAFIVITLILLIVAGAFGYFYEQHYHVWAHLQHVSRLQAFWK